MKLWIVLFHHKHGVDTWPMVVDDEPNGDDIIKDLREKGDWDEDDDDRGSYIDVRGPFQMGPTV